MIKDRLSELRQCKPKATSSLSTPQQDNCDEDEGILWDAEEYVQLQETNVQTTLEYEPQDNADADMETCITVPHNPILEALFKVYSEILLEFDFIQGNLNLMQEMILAKNASNFNEKEFYTTRKRTIQVANNVMGKFQTIESHLPVENDYRTIARMKRILYYGLFQRYVEIWTKTEEFLNNYETTMKNKLRTQSKILEIHLTEEEIDTLITNKETSLYSCNILDDTENARKTLKALTDRLGELKKLEKSIEEVHTLFLRLQRMVAEQGAVMQRIEKHYNDAQDYVQEATNDISDARVIMKSNLKKRIILIVVSLILILIIILLIIFL